LWRRSLPILLIALGVCLLTGCFYLPLPEHQFEKQKKVDFRPMLGQANSNHPLRPGITRA